MNVSDEQYLDLLYNYGIICFKERIKEKYVNGLIQLIRASNNRFLEAILAIGSLFFTKKVPYEDIPAQTIYRKILKAYVDQSLLLKYQNFSPKKLENEIHKLGIYKNYKFEIINLS